MDTQRLTEQRRDATTPPDAEGRPFGPVAAAFLAAGVGSVVLGILTTLAEASAGIKETLELTKRVGPLSGKTTFGVAAYAVAWAILARVFRGKDPDPGKVFAWTIVLVGIGLLLTFPIFFMAFAPEE
jgi:hypothetical protein